MPQSAIEQIEEVRGGERSVWFAGVKGFLTGIIFDIKNSVSAMLTSFVAGGVVGALALGGAALAGAMGWLGDQHTLSSGLTKLLPAGELGIGAAVTYIGSVAIAASAATLGWVGAVGARKEIMHAKGVNRMIDHEIQHAKNMAKARFQEPEAAPSAAIPVISDITEARRSYTKMLQEQKTAVELAPKGATIH